MNQKHMDSISFGIHMGLNAEGVGRMAGGGGAFGEECLRSRQTPRARKQQFEVCGGCAGLVPVPVTDRTRRPGAAPQLCPGPGHGPQLSACACPWLRLRAVA